MQSLFQRGSARGAAAAACRHTEPESDWLHPLPETYHYNFPRGIVFTENGNVIPGWNNADAYSANINAGLALPVWKRFRREPDGDGQLPE